MCECKGVEIGSHSNQVNLKNWWNGKTVSVDKCISKEILYLWSYKIKTTGSCCGHNKLKPMINVDPKYHNKMGELGYTYVIHQFNTRSYDPKTIKQS